MLIFTLVKSFVGIDSGDIPYPILTFAALMPWIFFQEATSESINSVVSNAMLIRKIYFPREILPPNRRAHQAGGTGYQLSHSCRVNDLLSDDANSVCGLGALYYFLYNGCLTLHQPCRGRNERLLS